MKPGSHKSYAVTIHNYKTTDDAGKVHVINPKDITTYEAFPSGRRDEACRGDFRRGYPMKLQMKLQMRLQTELWLKYKSQEPV